MIMCTLDVKVIRTVPIFVASDDYVTCDCTVKQMASTIAWPPKNGNVTLGSNALAIIRFKARHTK